jgi:hypothetical protein
MAEAVAALEVAGAIGDVVRRLYKYISAVKSAKEEILKLTMELSALKVTLEYFNIQSQSDLGLLPNEQVQGMLRLTRDTLLSMQKKLDLAPSGFGHAIAILAWPFHSSDVAKYLLALERSKTWFTMVIMCHSKETLSSLYAEIQRLSSAIQDDIASRKTDIMLKEVDEVVKWLAPVNSAEELTRAHKDRVSGTCQWIWDSNLTAWQDSSGPSTHPLFWITGKCA